MFGSNNRLVTGGPAPPAVAAADIDEVQNEVMGFTSLGEDKKLRFLPKPWPDSNLPQPTSQLFSVASIAGLVAAADPDTLLIAGTEHVRTAFSTQGDFDNKIVPYEPQLNIPIGTRLSQVCFSSDNEYLVVCAEDGGGLQVYKTAALKQGNTQFAFQYATSGIAVRALVPNPTDGRVFAVVLGNGMLALAEFNPQGSGADMKPLKDSGVSCVSWSLRGKQLVAGLEDGTVAQLQPNGTQVVSIPKPPQLTDSAHVGSLVWLDNDNFLVVYNPNQFDQDRAPESASFMVRRIGKNESFEYRKFGFEPAPAFGMNRAPPHHFFSRIRDYEPSLKDAIIISNTCSSDIGLVAKYTDKLSPDQTNVVDTYAMLTVEDNRKALLPDKPDDMDSPYTSPLGTAVDLSSTSQVKRPLPKEENLDATGPLPAYMILNNEGILSAWWFIHESAIKQSAPYKQLVVNGGPQLSQAAPSGQAQQAQQASPFASAGKTQTASAFGAPSALGQQKSAFAQPSTFGSPSPLGQARPAFGQSGFASAASSQPAFGQTSTFGPASSLGLGANAKTFGSGAASGGTDQSSPFASFGQNTATSSPFAAIKDGGTGSNRSIFDAKSDTQTNGSPFGSKDNSGPSVFSAFGKKEGSTDSPFGATSKDEPAKSAFSNTSTTSPFGAVNQTEGGSIFQRKPTPPDSPFAVLKKEQQQSSFGSTVTIGSTLGTNTSFGVSSLSGKSPFATPALSNQPSEVARPSTERPNNQPDSDTNMDGLSGLGLGGKRDEDREETPKPETKPVDTVPPKAEPSEPPLPPDPFAAKPAKKEESADATSVPFEAAAASLPGEEKTPPSPEAKSVEPAPLPPSPKPTKAVVPPSSPSSSPFATPIKKEETDKPLSLFPPKQEKKPSSPLARASTPPVDFKPEESPTRESSAVGSEPEDLGNDSAYVDSPTRSQLPQSEEDDTQASGVSTWPRSPRGKQPPLPMFGQQSPAPSQPTEANTPFFSPDTATKAPLGQTPFTSKPTFQPPQHAPGSPRSPSPVRDQQIPGRRMMQPRRSSGSPSRSSSRSPQRTSSMNQVMTAQQQPQQQRVPTPQLAPVKEAQPAAAAPARPLSPQPKPAPRPEDLDLDEAAEAEEQEQRAKLDEPLEASMSLGAFEAHADYVGHIRSSTLASQLERLYRDVESMLDTLGWNSRTMGAFIKGHTENYKDGRTHDDLHPEHQAGWTLVELEDLKSIVQDLAARLEEGRPQDVRGIQGECREFLTTTSTLTKQAVSIERQLAEIKAAQEASSKSTPRARLSADQANTLSTLRSAQARVLETLRQAEESASVLRAKVAAAHSDKDTPGAGAPAQIPTVEAVTNTIAKMTRMAEQKRGDIDHLESVVRRLRRERRAPPPDPNTLDVAALSLDGAGANAARNSPNGTRVRTTPRSNKSTTSTTTPTATVRASTSKTTTPERSTREGSSFAVPDSDSEGETTSSARRPSRSEAAHLRLALRRGRERVARRLPGAALGADDVADRRVERARRARVLEVLRDVVVARHEEEMAALQGAREARLQREGEESAALAAAEAGADARA